MIAPLLLAGLGAVVILAVSRHNQTHLDAPVSFPEGAIPAGDWGLGHVTREQAGKIAWVVASFPPKTLTAQRGSEAPVEHTVRLVVAAAEPSPALNLSFFVLPTGKRLLIKLNFPPGTDDEPSAILSLWGLDD